MLQFNIFKNTVVDKPTIAPVAVAKTNHFRILEKITNCSVSLRLIRPFYPTCAVEKSPINDTLPYMNCFLLIWVEIISHFGPEGLGVATEAIERFVARAVQLYEQEREEASGSSQLGFFVRRWHRWVRCIASEKAFANQDIGRLLTLFQTFHFSGHLGVFLGVYRCRFSF